MIIGSHVSMSEPEYLLGSVKEALSYNASTFMFYTGAPQNTKRKPVSALKVPEAKLYMQEHQININDVVVHAPYIINLANTVKKETRDLAISFLKEEIERVESIGCSILVLHPGSHVGAGTQAGLDAIVDGLNQVLNENMSVKIALETMAGKGTECGRTLDELAYIIHHVKLSQYLGVCLDTCHLHDAGYDLNHFNELLDEFDKKIGLDKLLVVHINDSKNEISSHKDRHANIGTGYIGFDTLYTIVHHPLLENVPKILETPYINKVKAPYKEEIEMLKSGIYQEIADD